MKESFELFNELFKNILVFKIETSNKLIGKHVLKLPLCYRTTEQY